MGIQKILIGYFILRVWFFKYESFNELLPHFFASLFYVHNIVYDAHSAVNGIAWSLEVEIQFYLLMPLLSYLYAIKNTVARRIFFLVLIIGGAAFRMSAHRVTIRCGTKRKTKSFAKIPWSVSS